MPIAREDFRKKTIAELDTRYNRLGEWILSYMTEKKEPAFTTHELAELVPKEVCNTKHKNASVYQQVQKLVIKRLVVRKGSYYALAGDDIKPTPIKNGRVGKNGKT